MIFARWEDTGFGEMSVARFRHVLGEPDFRHAIVDAAGHR